MNKETLLKITILFGLLLIAMPAHAQKCGKVTGKADLTSIPAPNDPFGRFMGPSKGNLSASVTSTITSVTVQVDGSLSATSLDVWVLGPQDILVFNGAKTYTQIPGDPIGTLTESTVLTAVGGSGAYTGATGTVLVEGTGFNIFGPDAHTGNSYFNERYEGTICLPK